MFIHLQWNSWTRGRYILQLSGGVEVRSRAERWKNERLRIPISACDVGELLNSMVGSLRLNWETMLAFQVSHCNTNKNKGLGNFPWGKGRLQLEPMIDLKRSIPETPGLKQSLASGMREDVRSEGSEFTQYVCMHRVPFVIFFEGLICVLRGENGNPIIGQAHLPSE